MEGNGVGDAVLETLDLGVAGLAQRVGDVFEVQATVIGLDREDLAEDRLEALGLALLFRQALLKEVQIRGDLDLDQVGRGSNFTKLTEVLTLRVGAVGHGDIRLGGMKKMRGRRATRRSAQPSNQRRARGLGGIEKERGK